MTTQKQTASKKKERGGYRQIKKEECQRSARKKEKGANKGREDHTFRKPHPRSKECGAAVAPAARARRSHGDKTRRDNE